MSLILHLMTKDARYLRYELVLWVVLVSALPGLMLSGVDTRTLDVSPRALGGVYQALWALQLLIGGLLAAQVAQSDALVGTTAFWRTRPIGRATLLASKLGLAAFMLLAVPFVAELAAYLLLGMSLGGSLAAALGACLSRASLVFPALAVGVITRDVPRFVLVLIALLLGMVVVRWTMVYEAPHVFAIRSGEYSATLNLSQFLVFSALLLVGGVAVVVHQHLSLNTTRSMVLIPVAIVACLLPMGLWPYDFLRHPDLAVDLARFDPTAVTLSLQPMSMNAASVISDSRGRPEPSREISGRISALGTPMRTAARPIRIEGTLKLAGQTELTSRFGAPSRVIPYSASYATYDELKAMIDALGPITWSNLDWTVGGVIVCPLISVPETAYRTYSGRSADYSAVVVLAAFLFESAANLPIRPHASYQQGSKRVDITRVESSGGVCVTTLREISVSNPWTAASSAPPGQYILVNRTTNQALFPERDDSSHIWSGGYMSVAASEFTLIHRELTFRSPAGSDGPALDSPWLAQAQLVRVEPVPLGVFTKRLKVDKFVLPPLR